MIDIERLKELQGLVALNTWMSERAKKELLTIIDEAIARQSVKSEEVQEAIKDLEYALACSENGGLYVEQTIKQPTVRLSITALQAYEPKGE